MPLDIRTLSFSVSLVSFMAAFIMVMLSTMARQFKAIRYWAIGNTLYAIGFTLLMAREFIPDFFSIIIANILTAVGLIVVFRGMQIFLEISNKVWFIVLFMLLLLPLFLFFRYSENDLVMRTLITAVFGVVMLCSISIMLIKCAPKELRLSYWFAGSIFALIGLLQLLRAVMVGRVEPYSSIFSSNWLQIVNYSSMIAFEVLWTMGSVFMVTQRLSVELAQTARIDYLSKSLNRRAAQERLDEEVNRNKRRGTVFTIILVDVDKFKQINDQYGHSAGDAALIQLAGMMRNNIRAEDLLARWGGDEFLLMLVDTPEAGAVEVVERIQSALNSQRILWQKKSIDCTISVGIACFGISDRSLDETIIQADKALYYAKEEGGNAIVVDSTDKAQWVMI